MEKITNALKTFWNEHKILSIFLIGFFIRFIFVLIPIEFNWDELDYFWSMNGFSSTANNISITDRIIMWYVLDKHPYLIFDFPPPFPLPRNTIMTFGGPKFWVFDVLITTIYRIVGLLGVKIFIMTCNALGSISIYYLIKEFITDKKMAELGSIIYGLNFISIYYSIRIEPDNIYIGLAPLIILFFMKLIKEKKLKNQIIYSGITGLLAISIDIRSSFIFLYLLGVLLLIVYRRNDIKDLVKKILFLGAFCIIGVLPILLYSKIVYNDFLRQIITPIKFNASIPIEISLEGFVKYCIFVFSIFLLTIPYIFYSLQRTYREKKWDFRIISFTMLFWCLSQHILYYRGSNWVVNAQRWSLALMLVYTIIAIWGFEYKPNFFFLTRIFSEKNFLRSYIILSIFLGSTLILANKILNII